MVLTNRLVHVESIVMLLELCLVIFFHRDKNWIESEKMGAFLSVAQGSAQPPVFVEIDYQQADNKEPIALVGKGITFDRYLLFKFPVSILTYLWKDIKLIE